MVWEDLNPIDGICETLTELKIVFQSGNLGARWYDGSWDQSIMSLVGIEGYWGPSEITGSGNVWTITDSTGYGSFTITWEAAPYLSATIRGSILLPVDGATKTLCIRGTMNPPAD